MYFPAIGPILSLAQEVVELAVAGDILSARRRYDHVRIMRARLSRMVESDKLRVAAYWEREKGVNLAAADDSDSGELSDEQIQYYRLQAQHLNATLDVIREWLSSSKEPFSVDDLLSSEEGIALFLDNALPEVWDFSQDVLIVDAAPESGVLEALIERGQKKFIYVEDIFSPVQFDETIAELSSENEDVVLLNWKIGDPLDESAFSVFVGEEVPLLAVIWTRNSSGLADLAEEVDLIKQRLSQQLIGKRSAKEWPVVFTEQWLGQLSHLTSLRSATELRSVFGGRNVLIASPGPSLADSLPALIANRSAFIVLAPIRSLEAMFAAGVAPDFVVQVDATDFSRFIPADPLLKQVNLICSDYCHPSTWGAGFGNVFTMPQPHLVRSALSRAVHDDRIVRLPGSSVSVTAAEMAAAFGASSITLIGQDLSIARGRYVSDGLSDTSLDPPIPPLNLMSCRAIDGSTIDSKADYIWFIGEFGSLASRYQGKVRLINSTSFGAHLDGWEHIAFDGNPMLLGSEFDSEDSNSSLPMPYSSEEHLERCRRIIDALGVEADRVRQAITLCEQLTVACQTLADADGNDVTSIEELEAELQTILSSGGSMLHFYTSRHAMALAAATKSVESLSENLMISAEYYHSLVPRARKLARLLEAAAAQITSQNMEPVG